MTIQNSIVSGNSDDGTAPDLRPDPNSTLGIVFSLIGETTGSGVNVGTGTGNVLNTDPLLGPLADNGGPTLPSGAVIQTHALLPGSPALDAGNFNISMPPMFDQRGDGFPRVVQSVSPQVRIDIGAYESQGVPSFPDGDYNHDGIANAADYTFWKNNFGNTTVPVAAAGAGALASPTVGDSLAPLFFSPTAKTPAAAGLRQAIGASELVSESRSSEPAGDGLILLALADWGNTQPHAEAGGYIAEELADDESIALTLELAFAEL